MDLKIALSRESRLTVTRFNPASLKSLCKFWEQRTVGGHSQVKVGDGGQHGDQIGQVFADKRLAACQPYLFHPVSDEYFSKARDFFKCQNLVAVQEL
jgi:hypothetical protein